MTISSDNVKNTYAGNGSTKDYAITFDYFDNSEIEIYLRASDGTESLKTLTTHYTVSGGPGNSPLVTMITAPAALETLVIKRNVPFTQLTDYTAGDAFPADSHEAALDKLAALCQQLKETLSRTLVFPNTYSTLSDVKLPEPEANAVVKWNSTATALMNDATVATSVYKFYVHVDDAVSGYLNAKLLAGTGIASSIDDTDEVVGSKYTLSIDSTVATLDGGQELTSKTLVSPVITGPIDATATGSAVLDDDTFATASDTTLATSDSIKNYVDNATPATATASTKGIASFPAADFDITAGAISVKSGGITNDQLAGSIASGKLAGGITNDQLDGSIASGKLAGSIPDSKLNTISTADKVDIGALNIASGTAIDALADEDLFVVDDGASGTIKKLTAAQLSDFAGGGGGVGSIDTLFTVQAKSEDNPSSASGDDATWRGATASLTGTLSQSETAADLIHDEKVFKYASATGSTNDWWCYTKAVPQGYQNRNLVLQFQYYHTGTVAAGDFLVVIKDVTNGDILTDSLDQLPLNDSDDKEAKTYRKQVLVPADCASLEFGFHYLGTATDAVLCYDDIALSANQFLQVDAQLPTESFWGYDCSGASAGSSPKSYRAVLDNITVNSISALGTLDNNTNLGWYFQSNKKCKVDLNFGFSGSGGIVGVCAVKYSASNLGTPSTTTNNSGVSGYWDGYRIASVQDTHGTAYHGTSSASFIMEADEYIQIISESTGYQNSNKATVTMTVTPEVSSAILLSSQDEIFTDWVSYTPAWEGSPTVTNQQVFWRRSGPNLEIKGRMQLGSTPADTVAFSVPSGLTIDSSKLGGQGSDDVYYQGRILRVTSTVKFNEAGTNSAGLFFDKSQSINTTYLFAGTNYNAQSGNCIDNMSYNTSYSSGDGLDFYASGIPIQGWNSNFNPVLSMPLVDFGTFENTYSAKAGTNGGITSQTTPNAIASITESSTGIYAVVFTSGFFGVAPSVVGTAVDNNRSFGITSAATTSGFTYKINVASSSTLSSAPAEIMISRQGSDYRQPPQPTAAVIKPAVCILKDVKPYNDDGGSSSTGWDIRDLNTLEGESWFLTLDDPLFTLLKGMYEISFTTSMLLSNNTSSRLYDVTSGNVVAYSSCAYASSSDWIQPSHNFYTTVTISSSTQYRIESRAQTGVSNHGYGYRQNTDPAADSVFTQVLIRKLK